MYDTEIKDGEIIRIDKGYSKWKCFKLFIKKIIDEYKLRRDWKKKQKNGQNW